MKVVRHLLVFDNCAHCVYFNLRKLFNVKIWIAIEIFRFFAFLLIFLRQIFDFLYTYSL